MVHRTPSNGIFKFKHPPLPTYALFVQSQHDTGSYIQSTSISAQSRVSCAMCHAPSPLCVWIAVEYANVTDRVMVHGTPRNDTFKSKHASIPTYLLFVKSQHNNVPYIQSTSRSAQSRVSCAIAVVVCLNSKRVYNCDRVIVHHTPSNNAFKFKHAPLPTYLVAPLFVKSQHDTVPYI